MSEAFDYDFDPLPEPVPYVPNPVEVQLYPDAVAAWTVSVPPGAATAGVLALLDPGRLSQAGRVDALMALDRLQAWAAALQIRVITTLVDDPCSQSPAPKLDRGWAKEDVKTCLGESVSGARHRIRAANELVHRLPDTLAALEADAEGVDLDVLPARQLIWLIVAATFAMALAALALAPLAPVVHAAAEAGPRRKSLLRQPAFLAVLAAAGLIQASHAVYYGFSALEWRAAGLDGTTIAGLWALGVLAEIVLFAFSARLPPFVTPGVLLIAGGIGGALRWTAMAFDPPTALLPLLQLLHALSFGTTFLGSLWFVAQTAPSGQAATAQGYLAIASGAAMAAAMGVSGLLYAEFGARAYLAMALAAVVGGACALVAHRLVQRAGEPGQRVVR